MELATFESVLAAAKMLSLEEQRRLAQHLESQSAQLPEHANGGDSTADHREREMRWFADEKNRAKYGSQWVALDGDQLLSHGEDLRRVYAEARAKGVEVAFTGYVDPLPGAWNVSR